jgi:hypothetical protein
MIHCWTLGRKVVQIAHQVHRAIHRVRHYYHSSAVKIVAPAIVCISAGAGLTPWLASAPPLIGQGPPAGLFSGSAVPVGGGIFVGPHSSDILGLQLTVPPDIFEFPRELASLNFSELVPNSNETLIIAPPSVPSQSSQSVPEPSTALLFGAALMLTAIVRHGAAQGRRVQAAHTRKEGAAGHGEVF